MVPKLNRSEISDGSDRSVESDKSDESDGLKGSFGPGICLCQRVDLDQR